MPADQDIADDLAQRIRPIAARPPRSSFDALTGRWRDVADGDTVAAQRAVGLVTIRCTR